MTIRRFTVIFTFAVGLIGVANTHACAEPDPVVSSFQHELNRQTVAGAEIKHHPINEPLQSDKADSRTTHSEDRSSADPGRVRK